MIPSVSALLKTVTGKVLAGVIVATMGVGAAAAAGADVSPSLIVGEDDGVGDDEEADDPEDEDEGSDDGDDEGSDEGSDDDDDEGPDDDDGEQSDLDVDGDEADDNHGRIVSEFTQSAAALGLTGCAKGQATAAVARGDVDPSLPSLMDDLAPYIAKCGTDVESEEDPDAADGDEPADWKVTRDEGKLLVQEAQAAFDDTCGDDDDDSDGSDGSGDVAVDVDADADSDDDDEPMSEECRVLKQAAKDARDAWKAEWKGERDAEHDARKEARQESKHEQQAAKNEAKQDRANQGQKQDKSDQGKSADAPGKNK